MNKTCNVYTLKRQIGPRAIALIALVMWSAQAVAQEDGDHPFKSGYVGCEAAMARSLTTLLDETIKKFRTVETAEKVKALHLVADVAREHARTRQFSENEQLQMALLFKSISNLEDQELKPFATELLFIALKLTVNSSAPKIPVFETNWERFLKKVVSFETPGYSAHRAAVFGTLAMLEVQKIRNADNPLVSLQKAFNYVTEGWSEDYEITLHPAMLAIEAALNAKLPEGSRFPLDMAMAGMMGLVEKSLNARRQTLNQERFAGSYIWLIAQVEIVSRSPALGNFPKLTRKMTQLKGSIGVSSSLRPN